MSVDWAGLPCADKAASAPQTDPVPARERRARGERGESERGARGERGESERGE